MPVAVIDGVRIPDPALVELIVAARAQGFRFEAGTNSNHSTDTGFTLYPPDRSKRPIRAGCSDVNPGHVRNIRRTLIQSGFDPNLHSTDEARETPVPKKTGGGIDALAASAPQLQSHEAPSTTPWGPGLSTVEDALGALPQREREHFAMTLIERVCLSAGLQPDTARLLSMQASAAMVFEHEFRDNEVCSKEDLDKARADADAAMKLAQENEERATTAEKHLATAKKDASNLGNQLTEALKRAEAAETEVREMRAAIEPFRALLGKS